MQIKKVRVNDIITGKYQMRFNTAKKDIDNLARSIKMNGLLCPPAATRKGSKYVLAFGHRRLQAVKKLKWKEVDLIILEGMHEKDMVIKTLVENIEKVDLTPLEKAKAYQNMLEELDITQQELADRCGRSQSEIAHHIRLLSQLNHFILDYLEKGRISFGHAMILMMLDDKNKQLDICNEVMEKDLSIKSEWRSRINIRQGKKEEKLVVSFKDREELKDLIRRLSRIL